MGVISNIKNKYRVSKNSLWVINTIFIAITMAVSVFAIVYSFVFSNMEGKFVFSAVLLLSVVVNAIALFCNRNYINTPIAVVAIVVTAVSVYMIISYLEKIYWIAVVPCISIVFYIATVVTEYRIAKSEKSIVKIAKVKTDFDFRPEDVIEEYRLALNNIEKKYNMGEKDRDAFEKEKEELLSDTHHILREFIDNSGVSLLYKLETLYQAKRECIISEDSYLLWKNHLLKDDVAAKATKNDTKQLFDRGGITEEDFIHRQELFKDEFRDS